MPVHLGPRRQGTASTTIQTAHHIERAIATIERHLATVESSLVALAHARRHMERCRELMRATSAHERRTDRGWQAWLVQALAEHV